MFKKLVILSVLSVLSMNLSAAYLTQEKIHQLQQRIANADSSMDVYEKANLQLNLDILGKECPATFAELKLAAIASAKKQITDDAKATSWAMWWVTNTPYYFPKSFVRDGYALAKEYGFTRNVCYYVLNYQEAIGLTNKEAYSVLVNAMKGNSLFAQDYLNNLPHVVKLSEDMDDEVVKKDLQRINRVVTSRLTSDEEKWKPVVVVVRTLLDLYK